MPYTWSYTPRSHIQSDFCGVFAFKGYTCWCTAQISIMIIRMEMRIMETLETELKNGNRLMLVFPTLEHKEAAPAYRKEYFDNGELKIHGDGGLDNAEDYEQWIEKINIDLNRDGDGFVPATTYFAFVGDKIVGTIQVRHRLNDYLLKYGGHIGYGVVPSERRKGYASEMLRLALKKCNALGIERALVTCDKTNIASASTILKNNGVLENEVTDDEGEILQRYWITVR